MGISLPEQARQYFDKSANELVDLVESRPLPGQRPPIGDSSIAHRHPAAHLSADDFIGDLVGSQRDLSGNETTRIVRRRKRDVGFWEERYKALDKVVSALAKRGELRPLLSREFLLECLFKWTIDRHLDPSATESSFSIYLEEMAREDIHTQTIGIPLANIEIEKPFRVGKVVLDYLRKDVFDKLESAGKFKTALPKLRGKYQGIVTSMLTCRCEEQRAIEIAIRETEKALIVLRFFSPAAVLAQAPCYLGRLGVIEVPAGHFCVLRDEPVRFGTLGEERRESVQIVSAAQVRDWHEMGMKEFSDLIASDDPTDFDESLTRALELYTRGLVSRNVQDRVVLALAAAETLLLKSDTEAIQQNVGQRLAVLVAGDLESRKAVMQTIRDAYRLRSAFLHHGSEKEDLEVLEKLQHHVWDGLRNATLSRRNYATKLDLAQTLEDHLLG